MACQWFAIELWVVVSSITLVNVQSYGAQSSTPALYGLVMAQCTLVAQSLFGSDTYTILAVAV
jgi:hypothetical protein